MPSRYLRRLSHARRLLRVTPMAIIRHSQHVDVRLLDWPHAKRLRFSDNFTYESRGRSVIRLLDQALNNEDLQHVKWNHFCISTGDQPSQMPFVKTFVFCDNAAGDFQDVLYPDFLFDGWAEVGVTDYEETRLRLTHLAGASAAQHRVGWIGTPLNAVRRRAQRMAQDAPRMFDFRSISWVRQPDGSVAAADAMTLEQQQAEWTALLDLEGYGWSARLKLLLAMGRPVLIQERPWKEWWQGALIPHVHYAPVRRDLSDLRSVAQRVLGDSSYAEALAVNAVRFSQSHLTRGNAHERIRQLLL